MSDARLEAAARWFAAEDGYTPEHYERCTDAHKDEWRSDAHSLLAVIDVVERGLADQLATALEVTRNELARHGWGDMHYGRTPQEPRVVAALATADEALRAARGSSVRTQESATND